MEENSFLVPLLLTIGGLITGAVLKSLLRNSRIPYTVALFAVGLLAGILNRAGILHFWPGLSDGLSDVANIPPDLILYLFLPILIFDAAYELNLHIFKKTLANATLLAVPGLIICMILTGALLVGIGLLVPGYGSWTWVFALMFGALISATDPVAVVALLHELKTSKRFSTLVDAESLLNDGTGLVCFMLFFGLFAAEGSHMASPLMDFIQVVGYSTLIGFLIARIIIWFITRINSEEMIQNSVVILSAYLTFILAQYYLGVSGVIALLVFGMTVTYTGKPRFRPQVNNFMERFWELLTYIANTLIFIIVGIVIAEKVDYDWTDFLLLILIYICLNLFRFIMIMMLYPIMKRMGYGLSRRESVILTWGGLLGALGMTLALMVSYTQSIPEDIRRQILFFTAGIVTLTLCVNATTTRWLLKKMGLITISSARIMLDYNIRKKLHDDSEKYLEKMEAKEALKGTDWQKVEHYIAPSPQKPDSEPHPYALLSELRLHVLDREKAACQQIYDEGIISQRAYRRLMNSLDELYDYDGTYPLDNRKSVFRFCSRTELLNTLRKIPYLHNLISFYFREQIALVYDLGRGFVILQQEDLKLLDEMEAKQVISKEQSLLSEILREELESNICSMNALIVSLSTDFPKAYRYALTKKSIRMLLSEERLSIRRMVQDGILTDTDAEPLIASIDERINEIQSFRHTIPAFLLRNFFSFRR